MSENPHLSLLYAVVLWNASQLLYNYKFRQLKYTAARLVYQIFSSERGFKSGDFNNGLYAFRVIFLFLSIQLCTTAN